MFNYNYAIGGEILRGWMKFLSAGRRHWAVLFFIPLAQFDRHVETMGAEKLEKSLWPLTAWDEIDVAAQAVGREIEPVEVLIRKYQIPLRVHLCQRFSTYPVILNHAEDLLQDFALAKILRQGWLKKADPKEGRFRDFLRSSLERFVLDWWRKQPQYKAWRKGMEKERLVDCSGTDRQAETAFEARILRDEQPGPHLESASFTLAWVKVVLGEALQRMEADCKDINNQQPERSRLWELFRIRELEPIYGDNKRPGYEELVNKFGFQSPKQAHDALATAKRIFKRHLEAVVKEYTSRDGEAQSEMRNLQTFLGSLRSKDRK